MSLVTLFLISWAYGHFFNPLLISLSFMTICLLRSFKFLKPMSFLSQFHIFLK